MKPHRLMMLAVLLCGPLFGEALAAELPGQYFRLLKAGISQVEERLALNPSADLHGLEARGHGSHLFPHVVLVAAVLYAKPDPSNQRYKDPKLLSLAMKIGDLLANE